jgi:choline dehydrogenase-like flavoprotein
MLLDGRNIPNNGMNETDVCIIGGGAAGITLAREFAGARFKVSLFESGGYRFNHRTQLLYRAVNCGQTYYDIEFTKQRYFGGATNKWYGRCRPLDAIDFETRPWVKHSGWPFGKKELDPFYFRAHDVCQLRSANYDPSFWETDEKKQLALNGTPIESKIFQFSPPTRFASEYVNIFKTAPNIQLFLNSNAVSIALNPEGGRVTHVNFATLAGNKFQVKARLFILAASALEIARLLLVSNDVHSGGIGNQHDLVGRFFMEHPHIFDAILTTALPDKMARFYKILDYDIKSENLGTVAALGLTENTIRLEKMLNASAFFIRRKGYKSDDRYFSKAGVTLTKVMDTFNHTCAPGIQFFRYAKDTIKDIKAVSGIVKQWLNGLVKPITCMTIRTQLETAPNPDSRVTLSQKKDRLGMNKLRLDWQLTDLDLESYRKFNQILCKGLRMAGIGVRPFKHDLDEYGWPVSMVAGKHHMGTTRMHQDPKKGVLNADCKVHGVANLYVAGSSIFPTSGQANPMLTLVALAIRLADHVKQAMSDTPRIE